MSEFNFNKGRNSVYVIDCGLLPYQKAWDLQEKIFAQSLKIKAGNRTLPLDEQHSIPHFLLLVEHPPVFTIGKSGKDSNLLVSETLINQKGGSFFRTNRGGDITFHGPGQLVAYPIFDLDQFFTDIHKYLRTLEEVVIQTLSNFGVIGSREPKYTGVWVGNKKICAMGVRASRWITMHGLALNIKTDLSWFDLIVPCGISESGLTVTSLQNEIQKPISLEDVTPFFLNAFSKVFDCELITTTLESVNTINGGYLHHST